MKKLTFFAFISLLTISGCASHTEQPFTIAEQKLHTRLADDGARLFAFIVTVEQQARIKLDTHKEISRSEFKRFVNEEHIEDSPSLKLALEERAVKLLKNALNKAQYCQQGHQIDEVYWKERKVQLRGKCSD